MPGTTSSHTTGGQIWSDVPFLVQDAMSMSKQLLNSSTNQGRNFAAFLAKLTSAGLCNDAFASCALIIFSEALEFPGQLEGLNNGSETSISDLIPPVLAWLVFASDRLIALSEVSFNILNTEASAPGPLARDAGVDSYGFSPARWIFWKKRLEELSQNLGRSTYVFSFNVRENNGLWTTSAFHCLRLMKDSGEHINGVLTEADDMFK